MRPDPLHLASGACEQRLAQAADALDREHEAVVRRIAVEER
jgi:hypothetical protein